jgi:hypothetical protein
MATWKFLNTCCFLKVKFVPLSHFKSLIFYSNNDIKNKRNILEIEGEGCATVKTVLNPIMWSVVYAIFCMWSYKCLITNKIKIYWYYLYIVLHYFFMGVCIHTLLHTWWYTEGQIHRDNNSKAHSHRKFSG